jgi:hypothetical protein
MATHVAAAAAATARSTAMAGPDDLRPFAKRRSNSTSMSDWTDADDVNFSRASRTSAARRSRRASAGSPAQPRAIISAVRSVILCKIRSILASRARFRRRCRKGINEPLKRSFDLFATKTGLGLDAQNHAAFHSGGRHESAWTELCVNGRTGEAGTARGSPGRLQKAKD